MLTLNDYDIGYLTLETDVLLSWEAVALKCQIYDIPGNSILVVDKDVSAINQTFF